MTSAMRLSASAGEKQKAAKKTAQMTDETIDALQLIPHPRHIAQQNTARICGNFLGSGAFPTVNNPCVQGCDLRHTVAGARTTAIAAASSMIAAPAHSRQVSGAPKMSAPSTSAT